MGDEKRRESEKQPDRLAEAVAKKVETIMVDGRTLRVRQWNLHTSLTLMGTLGDILKQMVASVGPKMDVASLLQRDVGQLLLEHEASIVKILVGSITPSNFKDLQEAEAWVNDLGVGDALRLFSIIARQNIRPLVKAVGEIAKEVGAKVKESADEVQKVSRRQTS